VTLRTPTRGSAAATVSYDVPYGTDVRGVEPLGAGTVTRYVAVEKVPDGEVRVARAERLEPADFADLPLKPPETTAQSVARVLVGAGGPFALALDVKRHTFEEMAKAVIYRALGTAVVDRSGWTRVLVSYRVYNRSEQFLRLGLPDGARLLSVFVAGEGVRPLAEGEDLLVPLRKLALGAPTFDVDVVYAYAGGPVGDGESAVRIPVVRKLDVRRTTLTLHVPRGFAYDFETAMEEVTEADIAAGEATDVYQEIKELYDVAQRGNRFQANRALSNVQQLEQEANRLMDYIRGKAKDRATLQQVESQQRALDRLRETNAAPAPQVAADDQPEARGIESWDVNETFLKRAGAEQRKQVEEFARRRQEAPQGQAATRETETTVDKSEPIAGDKAKLGTIFNDGADGDWRGRAENVFEGQAAGSRDIGVDLRGLPGGAAARLDDISAAKGRISLRIDLPKEGDVYHFARLGGAGGVSFDADEEKGALLEGALALLCAAAAAFVFRFRAR
jgi:hypothetical protein